MSGKKLKPCAFCGQKLHEVLTRRNPHAYCKTNNCKGAQLPILSLDICEDIERWNKRFESWISVEERLPDVEQGRSEMFLVCALSTAYKKQSVYPAYYLNEFVLRSDDEDIADEDGYVISNGWFYLDAYIMDYSKIPDSDEYKITHWRPLPEPPCDTHKKEQSK